MSYRGFIPLIVDYCGNKTSEKGKLRILEIGVMNGLTTFPLLNNLTFLGVDVEYIAVDIWIRESVMEMANYSLQLNGNLFLVEDNSLNFLKQMKDQNHKFDVILVDGDHNYETVKKECEFLNDVLYDDGIVIFDDFHNKHAEKDSYYSEEEEYKNVSIATKRTKASKKEGTKPAILEYLEDNKLINFGIKKNSNEYHAPIVTFKKNNKIMWKVLFSIPRYSDFLMQAKSQVNPESENA